jgi:transcription antitermination factor NusG
MPVLSVEPYVFPHDLFVHALQMPTPGQARWWVLHTRPRAEKALVRKLLRRQSSFFLPLCPRRFRSRGRWLCSYLPLFPGYVFLYGDHEERLLALETGQVVRCLDVPAQDRLAADLERVHRLMTTGAPLAPEHQLATGALVEVTAGPFAGLQGKVLHQRGAWRLLVEVDFLQRGVSVELEDWMVRPAERGFHSRLVPSEASAALACAGS